MNTQCSTFNMFFVIIVVIETSLFMRSIGTPQALDAMQSIHQAVGESVTLPCPRTVDSPVNWWYQASSDSPVIELCVNGELINGNKKRFNLDKNTYGLTLVNATLNDTGIYTCTEQNGFGQSHAIQLTVRRSSRKTMTAFVGEPAVLSCQTAAMDTPANWLYQTSDISPAVELCVNGALINGHVHRFSVDVNDYSLTIKELQLTDSGFYTCIENTGFGEHYITELSAVVLPETTVHGHLSSPYLTQLEDNPGMIAEATKGNRDDARTIIIAAAVIAITFFISTIVLTAALTAKYIRRKLRKRGLSESDSLISSQDNAKHVTFWLAHAKHGSHESVEVTDTANERNIFVLTQYPELHEKYVQMLSEHIQKHHPDVAIIAGLDIRGLIFALPIAQRLHLPFVPISKSGKLACQTIPTVRKQYTSPTDGQISFMEVQSTACRNGQQVVIVDDELCTGATMKAAIECIQAVGGVVVECVAVMEVLGLGGREKVASCNQAPNVFSLLHIHSGERADWRRVERQLCVTRSRHVSA